MPKKAITNHPLTKLVAGSLCAFVLGGILAAPTLRSSQHTVPSTAVVHADTTDSSSSQQTTHTLTSPYVVYGSGVAQEVYPKLNDAFQIDSSFKKLTVNAADYHKYINNDATTDAAMISSVAIAPGDPGSGVKVNIKPYNGADNITKVTAQQYALVAQMAGVTDITITVTANRAVSGESALTGVYKALATDGAPLNTTNTASANQLLDATQTAIDANKDDTTYPSKLMTAVGDTTKAIAQEKQASGALTEQEIAALLDKYLAKQGISNTINNNQRTLIINALINFQKAPIANSKSYVSNVTNTINNIKTSSGNLMNKAKNWFNSATTKKTVAQASKQAEGWWDKFVAWLKSLFN